VYSQRCLFFYHQLLICLFLFFFFFFQAEDGIRDFHVTGVQTCALPILATSLRSAMVIRAVSLPSCNKATSCMVWRSYATAQPRRSEERRVGKEGRTRVSQDH